MGLSWEELPEDTTWAPLLGSWGVAPELTATNALPDAPSQPSPSWRAGQQEEARGWLCIIASWNLQVWSWICSLCWWGWGGVGGRHKVRGTQKMVCPHPFFWPQHTPRDQGVESAYPGNAENIPGLHWEIWGFLSDVVHGSLRGWIIVWGQAREWLPAS